MANNRDETTLIDMIDKDWISPPTYAMENAKQKQEQNKARQRWLRAFQKYCDSDEIFEESSMNGINACGYGIQCDCCKGSEKKLACAMAMDEYAKEQKIKIDYSNITKEYFRKLLLYIPERKEAK